MKLLGGCVHKINDQIDAWYSYSNDTNEVMHYTYIITNQELCEASFSIMFKYSPSSAL